jgi:hypothetical protein
LARDGELTGRGFVDASIRLYYFSGHHDDDPHLQYRFGLVPQPLTACPRQRAKTTRSCRFWRQRDSGTE